MAESRDVQWRELLSRAVSEPGTIQAAYSRFWSYSMGNQLLALWQCSARGIEPGPLATYPKWGELGRHVKRGEKALVLCMPVTCKRRAPAAPEAPEGGESEGGAEAAGGGREFTFTRFVYRPLWFTLAQTDGAEFKAPEVPGWDRERALQALGVSMVPFEDTDGNCQGYAQKGRRVAVSPIAGMPEKTLFHELAHVLLHLDGDLGALNDGADTPRNLREVEAESVAYLVCESLGLSGGECCRGYIQGWLGERQDIPERSAQRIFHAADAILKAGQSGGRTEVTL